MSKEIKFRVWDKDTAKYITAENSLEFSNFAHLAFDDDGGTVVDSICPGRYCYEQCTGLADKNGKEIYEGDIIRDTSDGDCLINCVFWCEKGGFWGVRPRSPFAGRDWGWFIGRDDIEVIGNIHENKELLEGNHGGD